MALSAITAAVDALFTDPNIGRDALWRDGGNGAGVAVRVVFRAPDTVANYGGGRFVAQSRFVDVRTADLATLGVGDTFEIGGNLYVVQGEPMRDDDNLVWSAEVRTA
jgi:hypothetical protein